MTITVHVETCPTCHGKGIEYDGDTMYPEVIERRCRACRIVPGYDVPDPWFVVVPMAAHGGEHAGATGWYAPDPDWQPGASVTLTADCPDCHPDNWTGDRNVIDHLHEHGALREAVEAMDGEACCTNGEVVVGSAVIADLVLVESRFTWEGRHYIGHADGKIEVDRTTWEAATPGATLARLETTPISRPTGLPPPIEPSPTEKE